MALPRVGPAKVRSGVGSTPRPTASLWQEVSIREITDSLEIAMTLRTVTSKQRLPPFGTGIIVLETIGGRYRGVEPSAGDAAAHGQQVRDLITEIGEVLPLVP